MDSSINKRNYTISVLRVIAIAEIVLCHFLPNILRGYNVSDSISTYIGMFFGNGVILFFILSGFLYGQKKITNVFRWLIKQFIKLSIPVVLLVIIECIHLISTGKGINASFIIIHLFNLTGLINFDISSFINSGYNMYLSHLWYLTAIYFCYLITPLLQIIAAKKKTFVNLTIAAILLLGVAASLFVNNEELPHYFMYLFAYSLFYFYGKNIVSAFLKTRNVIIMVAVYVLSVGAYYLSSLTIGGMLFQDSVISQLFRMSTSLFIIAIVVFLFDSKRNAMCDKIKESLFIRKTDSYSYYIYLFHDYIMNVIICEIIGINIWQLHFSLPLWIVIMIVICFVDKHISDKLIGVINKVLKL